jgi:hypothetical protein
MRPRGLDIRRFRNRIHGNIFDLQYEFTPSLNQGRQHIGKECNRSTRRCLRDFDRFLEFDLS